jgi:hypothetical protein
MMKLMCVALALLAQQESPDREKARDRIIQLTQPRDCGLGPEEQREMAGLAQAALEILPELIQASDKDSLGSRLYWYGYAAELMEPRQTPAAIVNLARSGSAVEHVKAAQIALKIRDDRAHAFLIEGLKCIAAEECTESGNLDITLIERAGWSHSAEAGKILLSMIRHPHPTRRIELIDAVGNLGYAPALDDLKKLTADKARGVAGRSRNAIEKIELLASPDRAARLVEKIKIRLGHFPWREWALDQILHFRLSETAGELRKEYDDLVKSEGLPRDGTLWPAVVLHGIHKLGGTLSAEETGLLTTLGRLPPAKNIGPEAGELKKGFAAGVWAPRAQRQKEAEARNAPPPRIPEEKLPRIMEDRIRFVMNLKPPDPSYLAPHAALALGEIERMLKSEGNPREQQQLLEAYLYLARLREGMKTPDLMLRLAQGPPFNPTAALIVTTIADDRAEAWFLEEMKRPEARGIAGLSGRLTSPKVKEALILYFRTGDKHGRFETLRALADMGCVELLPELKAEKTNPPGLRLAIQLLEFLAAPDRDAKLLAIAKSGVRNTDFSYAYWARDQIVRLNLKEMGPELRKWFDEVKAKWAPSHRPDQARVEMILALSKLGMAITAEEERILKENGRRP